MKTNTSIFELELSPMELWFFLNQFSPCYILGFEDIYQGILSEEKEEIYEKCLDILTQRDLIRIVSSNELAIETSVADLFHNLINSKQSLVVSYKNQQGTFFHYFDSCKDGIIHRTSDEYRKLIFRKTNDQNEIYSFIDRFIEKSCYDCTKMCENIVYEDFLELDIFDSKTGNTKLKFEKNEKMKGLNDEIINDINNPFSILSFALVRKGDSTKFSDAVGFGLLIAASRIWVIEKNIRGNKSLISFESISTLELNQKLSKVIPNFGGLQMHRLIITLKIGNKSKTLDVPGDEIVGVLKGHIIKSLGGNLEGNQGSLINYWLENQSGKKIEDGQTLINAGIKNHDIIQIRRQAGKTSINAQVPYFDSLSSFFDDEDEEQTPEIGEQSQGDKGTSSVGGFETLD